MATRYVLIIGIREYVNAGGVFQSFPRLDGVERDVLRLRQVLESHPVGGYENHFIPVRDRHATKSTILEQLDIVVKRALNPDQVVIYFAGHCDRARSSADDQTYYLIPHDAARGSEGEALISGTDLAVRLKYLTARELIVILDCCYGEALVRALLPWTQQDLTAMASDRMCVYAMTAARKGEQVPDMPAGGRYSFTEALCEALSLPDDGGGPVSAESAYRRAKSKLADQRSGFAEPKPDDMRVGDSAYLLTQPQRQDSHALSTNSRSNQPAPAHDDAASQRHGGRAASAGSDHRADLLRRMRSRWIGQRLTGSLFAGRKLDLSFKQLRGCVLHDRSPDVPAGEYTIPLTDGENSIVDLYKTSCEQLLILGDPGSGKTNQLLKLLDYLLQEAERDPVAPVPVVFELHKWRKGMPLGKWMTEELNHTYGERRAEFDTGYRIIPLLDGLDHVVPRRLRGCCRAINAFSRAGHNPNALVVTCCKQQYLEVAQHSMLDLEMAVVVQPLSREAVNAHLKALGPTGLRVAGEIDVDESMRKAVESPKYLNLELNLAAPAERVRSGTSQPEKGESWLTAHIGWVVEAAWVTPAYEPARAKRWICWLASGLVARSMADFSIELLQPDWLPPRQRKLFIPGVLVVPGVGVGALAGFFLRDAAGRPFLGLLFGVAAGVVAIWAGSLFNKTDVATPEKPPFREIVFSRRLSWSWDRARRVAAARLEKRIPLAETVMAVLAAIMAFSRVGWLRFDDLMSYLFAIASFQIAWLLHVMLSVIQGGISSEAVVERKSEQSLRASFGNAMIFSVLTVMRATVCGAYAAPLLLCPFYWFFGSLSTVPKWLITAVFAAALWGWFRNGGSAVVKHAVLRVLITASDVAPLRYARFLDFACARKLLRKASTGRYEFAYKLLLSRFAALDGSGEIREAQP